MKWNRKVMEWMLSVGVPILVVGGLFLKMNVNHTRGAGFDERDARIGDAVSLSGIDWGKNHLTLVMVMQVGCHWCEESGPFFRTLAKQENADHKFHIVAVLPQVRDKSQEFLHTLSINVQDVRQKHLDELGVSGTPTLILVDYTGKIKNIWVGKLPPKSEKQVFSDLGIVDNSGQADSR